MACRCDDQTQTPILDTALRRLFHGNLDERRRISSLRDRLVIQKSLDAAFLVTCWSSRRLRTDRRPRLTASTSCEHGVRSSSASPTSLTTAIRHARPCKCVQRGASVVDTHAALFKNWEATSRLPDQRSHRVTQPICIRLAGPRRRSCVEPNSKHHYSKATTGIDATSCQLGRGSPYESSGAAPNH